MGNAFRNIKFRSSLKRKNKGAAYLEHMNELRLLFVTNGYLRHLEPQVNGSVGIFVANYPQVPPISNNQPSHRLYSSQQTVAGNNKQFSSKNVQTSFQHQMKLLKFKKLQIRGSDTFLKQFTPLGLSSWVEGSMTQKKHRIYLYVVNAPRGQPCTVEVFFFKEKELLLQHQHTVKDDNFHSLSDIVVLSTGRFLVSQMFYFKNPWLRLFETLTQRSNGKLMLYDGKRTTALLSNLETPNGMVWDKINRRLFVALTTAKIVKILHIQPDLSVHEQNQVHLISSPNQLFLTNNGELWLTAHPVTYKYLQMLLLRRRVPTESHVLRLRFQEKMSSWIITEPLANNGSGWPAAGTLALIGDYLLVGSRHAKTHMCRIKDMAYV